MTDLTKAPYADKDGDPTPANPHYAAWKAKQDILTQDSVNGAPKTMPHRG